MSDEIQPSKPPSEDTGNAPDTENAPQEMSDRSPKTTGRGLEVVESEDLEDEVEAEAERSEPAGETTS